MKIQSYLPSSPLVHSVFPSAEVLNSLLHQRQNRKIKLLYGETFDEFGITIDSLKYYFFLSFLTYELQRQGYKVEATLMQADAAAFLNKSAQKKASKLHQQLEYRQAYIEKVIDTYHLPIKVVRMTDIFLTKEYQKNIEIVTDCFKKQKVGSTFMQTIEQTVLKNKLTQEREVNFQYARESIATSMLFDIKIGPTREQLYDQALQILANEHKFDSLLSIYLTPTYPLGKDFSYFLTHPEVEKFGLTPYKAGSNKLQDHRIVLDQTSKKKLAELINGSFESDQKTAHPVLDMYFIGDLARRLIEKETDFPIYDQEELLLNIPALRRKSIESVGKYVIERLKNDK